MFFKKDGEDFLEAESLLNINYELRQEFKDKYQYPVDGWVWFDTEEEARIFFNCPDVKIL